MSVKSNKSLRVMIGSVGFIMQPIYKNFSFFNMGILLMVIPTFINAFWVNEESFDFWFIIKMNKYGAGFPYVFFFPCFVSYIICLVHLIIGKQWFKISVYGLLFVLCIVNVFVLLNFKSLFTPWLFTVLIDTNYPEVCEFVDTFFWTDGSLITYCIACILLIFIFWVENTNKCYIWFIEKKTFLLPLFLLFSYFFYRGAQCVPSFLTVFKCETTGELEALANHFKFLSNTVSSAVFVWQDYLCHKKENEIVKDVILMADSSDSKVIMDDSLNVILVIGESYNKYHASLYGYYLKTTPFLDDEFEKGRLFVFQDVISPYNMTSFAVKNIFSTNSLAYGENWYSFPFFPVIFRKAGYKVFFWDNQVVSNNGDNSDYAINIIHSKSISPMCYDFQNENQFDYDSEFVQSIKDFLEYSQRRNLFIFHLMGQHFDAKLRFPPDSGFDVFSSKDIRNASLSEEQKQEVADYDNACYYNDYVLMSIFNLFSDMNSVIVYLSDHGEEVNDYREFVGRSHEHIKDKNSLKFQYEIPFVIICSDKYYKSRTNKIQLIRESINTPFMTDLVCNMLFNLGEVLTPYYRENCDPLSPLFRRTNRIVSYGNNYDRIMQKGNDY